MLRAVLAIALCAACKKPERFCDRDLSGLWLNSSDKHFAYRFREQDGAVRGEYLERGDDGGLKNPDDPVVFDLRRASDSVTGVMRGTGLTPGGRKCPVEYAIRLTSCQPDALQAQVETAVDVREDCRRAALEDGGLAPAQLAEFRFERAR